MTKEELKQEAEEWLNKWELCNKCDHRVECIEDNAFCPQVVERAYLAAAEPREKRIAELEATNKTISNECHKLVNSLEKKQNEVAELKKQLRDKKCNDKDCPVFIKLIQANKENAELKELVEKYRQVVDKYLHITFC